MSSHNECPSMADLNAFLMHREETNASKAPASDPNAMAMERHVEACVDCQQRLLDLANLAAAVPGSPCPPSLKAGEDSVFLRNIMRQVESDRYATDDQSKTPGMRQIGPYEVDRALGQGGVGVVYLATDRVLRRLVAIKMLRPVYADDRSMRERFLREARAVAALRHDHVVAIHGVGEHQGNPYLVMEYVEGGTLADQLHKQGPFSSAEVARLGTHLAAGLAAAHAKGILHRDIKPANVLWDPATDRYKLGDFGLAKALDDATLTQTGTVVGTPEFLSPEQSEGRPCDVRSDLFSLGGILYLASTGISPFHADSTPATLARVCNHTPPAIPSLRADCPKELWRVVQRLLAKSPHERYATAEEVVHALQRLLPESSTKRIASTLRTIPRRVPTPRHVGWGAFAALLVILLIGGVWYAQYGGVQPDPPISKPALTPGFYVPGKDQRFDTLSSAVAAAPSGGVIEVAGDERLTTTPVRIEGKPLTLRAADGSRPVLAAVDAGPMNAPLLSTDSNLTLEGLQLQWTTESMNEDEVLEGFDRCVVEIRLGLLRVDHCDIVAGNQTAGIGVASGQCELRNSRVSTGQGPCVVWRPAEGSKLFLENCILSGHSCILLPWLPPGEQGLPARLQFVGNTWNADRGIVMKLSFGPKMRFHFDVRNNRFGLDHFLVMNWMHSGQRAREMPDFATLRGPLSRYIDWQEKENIYSANGHFISRASPKRVVTAVPGSPTDIAAWEGFWNRPGTGSRQGSVPAGLQGQLGADEAQVGPVDPVQHHPN
jgi:serine/threonine protein kinase